MTIEEVTPESTRYLLLFGRYWNLSRMSKIAALVLLVLNGQVIARISLIPTTIRMYETPPLSLPEGNEMPTSNDSPTAGELRQGDVPASTDPAETNFPEADPTQVEEAPEATESDEPGDGEVWAYYTGLQPSQRILTVEDQKSLGDKKPKEPLVWDRNNRFRREVSGVHSQVLDYIEYQDGNFKVVRGD
jgi:hypothetical protein